MKKLIILLSLLFISTSYAQEAKKGLIYTIADFSGGLASKPSPLLLPSKYSTTSQNIRYNAEYGSISKRDIVYTYGSASATEPITGLHRLYLSTGPKILMVTHGSSLDTGNDSTGTFTNILSFSTPDNIWQFLTWHDLAIGGDGYNQPVKYDGTTATYLGTLAAKALTTGSGPSGTYTYKVAFYTASYTCILNVASATVTVSNKDISLTNIPLPPTDNFLGEAVIGRKVYRIANGGSTYYLLSNGTIANVTATTLTDSDSDAELTVTTYPAGNQTWTPPKGKFYLINYNRLLIAGDPNNPSRVYFSEDKNPDLFQPTSYFDIRKADGDAITFMKNLLGIVTIGKTTTIQKLYTGGSVPLTDWSISDPFSFTGCIAPYSAVNTPLGIAYLATDGLYIFNGQSSSLISDIVSPTIKDILPTSLSFVYGAFNNNLYYLSYASKVVGESANNRVLIYDLVGKSFTLDYLNENVFSVLAGSNDAGLIYAGSSTNGNVYTYGSTTQQVNHSVQSDFTGTFTNMRYIPNDPVIGGDSNSPVLELAWSCTIADWLTNLQTFNASINTLADVVTYLPAAIIARPTTSGTYISQVLNTTGATTYKQVFWNSVFVPGYSQTSTIAIRSGATSAACQAASWSSEYSISGSDISALTAGDFTQYRISLGTGNINYTPEVVRVGSYVVNLTYATLGTKFDVSIPFHWVSGYQDFSAQNYNKNIRKFEIWYSATSGGTITATLSNLEGATNVFSIDTSLYPTHYSAYTNGGAFIGQFINLDIYNNDNNPISIRKVNMIYDLEPIY